jgi:hypothetical protein
MLLFLLFVIAIIIVVYIFLSLVACDLGEDQQRRDVTLLY